MMKSFCCGVILFLIAATGLQAKPFFFFHAEDGSLHDVVVEQPDGWLVQESAVWKSAFTDPQAPGRVFAVDFFYDLNFDTADMDKMLPYLISQWDELMPYKTDFSIYAGDNIFVCTFLGSNEAGEQFYCHTVLATAEGIVFTLMNTNRESFELAREDYFTFSQNVAWLYSE